MSASANNGRFKSLDENFEHISKCDVKDISIYKTQKILKLKDLSVFNCVRSRISAIKFQLQAARFVSSSKIFVRIMGGKAKLSKVHDRKHIQTQVQNVEVEFNKNLDTNS